MDRAEAINIMENLHNRWATWRGVSGADTPEVMQAITMAIAALREQEQNEPLTLEQLRDMRGEPVWIIWPDGRIKSKWWIVGSSEWHLMEFMGSQSEKEYGTVWIAYRNKLGGADNG